MEYYTLEDLTRRWGKSIEKIRSCYRTENLKIWHIDALGSLKADAIGLRHKTLIAVACIKPERLTPADINATDFVVLKEDAHDFEKRHNIKIQADPGYPKELKIAVEVWTRVFSLGITPAAPPTSAKKMVLNELEEYGLVKSQKNRIAYIINPIKRVTKILETTVADHPVNEPGHIHFSKLLAVAVDVYERCRDSGEYKQTAKSWLAENYPALGRNESIKILELTNPDPKPGRKKAIR